MIGTKVQLKPNLAKWMLAHPEIYDLPGGDVEPFYEEETLIHLVCCLGEPVYGKITGYGSMPNCYLVKFRVGNLSMQYYCDRHHIEFL